MKRPLAAIGLIYLATSAAAVCFFPEVNLILCVMAAITAIAACFICREKMRDILIVMCPICTALLVIGCCQHNAAELSDQLGERACVISGEICEIPRRQYGRWRYTIETDSVELPGAKQKIRLLVTSRNSIEEAKEGDRLTCRVQFLQSSGETGYNSATSLRADGIDARAWCISYSEQQVTKGTFRLRYVPMKIRRAVVSRIRQALPSRASAMLCGMLLGDTDYMDSRTVENFRATGIAHLLAVSGLHLTLLTLALSELLRRLKVAPRSSSVIMIGFILLFMAVTGFPPSVIRAGVMHILALISRMIFRDADSYTSLSAAVLLMCLVNPWAAADIGLQLSVCATLGLLLAAGRTDASLLQFSRRLLIRLNRMPRSRKVRKFGKSALRSVSVSLTASLSILPLTAIHFGSVPLVSPLTNLLCVFAASAFIIVGMIASAIYCIPFVGWLISLPLRFAAAAICVYLETVAGGLAGLPFAALNTNYRYTPYLFLFLLLLTACGFITSRRMHSEEFSRRLRRFVLCEVAVMVLAAMLSHQLFGTGAAITVFDAGSGSVCVCAKNRTHAVFAEAGGDAYGLSAIREILRSNGVTKVDAIAVSDDSAARSGNLSRLLSEYSPDYLLTDIDFDAKTNASAIPYANGVRNEFMALCLETFTDVRGQKWERLTCGEATALICPEKGNCALLPEPWRSCDAAVLGRETSGLAALHVGAVIVTAKEKYAIDICHKLRNLGYRHVYNPSENGSITLSLKNGKLKIQVEG